MTGLDPLSPTPLVPITAAGDDVYGKLEYLHPSGSMKHRSIPSFLAERLASGELEAGRTIVVRSAGAAAVTTAWAGAQLGCPVVAVVPPAVTPHIVSEARWLGAEVHIVEPSEAPAVLEDIECSRDAFVIQQATEDRLIDGYGAVATEALEQLPGAVAMTVGIGTGLSVTGIARAVADHPRLGVFGVEPAEAPVAAGGPWAPHLVPGLAPPIAQPLLDTSRLAGLLAEPSIEAWRMARRVARIDGHLVGPSSGLTLAAAASLRATGIDGPIVAVCACSMAPYHSMTPTEGA